MKRLAISLILSTALAVAALAKQASTNDEVEARQQALKLAGGFGNDGFKLRDGNWAGTLTPGKPLLLQGNLYAGNQYWFTVGAAHGGKKLAVSVYDETGKPLETSPYQDDSVAAAGFAPLASGPYYVKVEVLDDAPTAFCLIYSYK